MTPIIEPVSQETEAAQQLLADPAVQLLANVARADLARRLSLAEEAVALLSAEEAELPAGSLGCPGTGSREVAGLVPGLEIVLAASGQEYVYRADNRRLIPCLPAELPGGHAPIFVTGGGLPRIRDLTDEDALKRATPPADTATSAGRSQPAVASALADLAARLKVGEEEIAVRSVEAVDWPDASLGCAQPGRMYAQVITPGYRILLEAGGQVYEYHASQTRAVLCRGG
ncbi:MAG: hypothetical protein BWY52_01650 [Chloroflexi bacterium ADurb.Bin325]|nr:MAG: hypothetical protein BWY52_01650 [Chloroflexi bacterium ADurb.Bin325]